MIWAGVMHCWGFKRVELVWWEDISFSLKNISSSNIICWMLLWQLQKKSGVDLLCSVSYSKPDLFKLRSILKRCLNIQDHHSIFLKMTSFYWSALVLFIFWSEEPCLVDRLLALHAGSRGCDSHRGHPERFFQSNRPGYPHPVSSELENSGIRVQSVIAVSLNVGGGVRLIKPAKLCMCAQNTTNTMRTDARCRVCVAMVPYHWATRGTLLGELEYTHTHTHIYISFTCPST